MNTRHPSLPCPKMMPVWLNIFATTIPFNTAILYNTTILLNIISCKYIFISFWYQFDINLGSCSYYSLTKRSLKGSYWMYKGGAMAFAPIGSPRPVPFSICFSLFLFLSLFPYCLQFPLVPQVKLPLNFAFENTFQIYL